MCAAGQSISWLTNHRRRKALGDDREKTDKPVQQAHSTQATHMRFLSSKRILRKAKGRHLCEGVSGADGERKEESGASNYSQGFSNLQYD